MKINILFICTVICFSSFSLFAQNKDDRYHRYGTENPLQLKIFGGPLVAFSNVEGYFSIDMGVTAGFMVRRKFYIGIYGQKLLTRPQRIDLATIGYPTFTNGEIRMMHAGGVIGYIHKPEQVIHWGVGSSGGIGRMDLYATNPVTLSAEKIYDDRVIVVTPKVFLEVNMTNYFKINLSGGFRVIGKVNGTYITNSGEVIPTFYSSDYDKPELLLTLIFGVFGPNRNFFKSGK
jgi:hypothetical protein